METSHPSAVAPSTSATSSGEAPCSTGTCQHNCQHLLCSLAICTTQRTRHLPCQHNCNKHHACHADMDSLASV